MKNWLKISIFLIIYVFFILLIGTNARELLLNKEKPFPTWTYNSEIKALNTLTSWDSGFYYDLAQNGYPTSNTRLPKAEIQILDNSWVKIFLGTAIIGNERFQLPIPSESNRINNMLVVVNPTNQPLNFPIYNAYEGINYCIYKGNLSYERDIKSFNESLTNPKSCGETSCRESFVSVYDIVKEKVIFQERYFDPNSPNSEITIGNSFPLYNFKENQLGLGCKTIGKENISEEPLKLYEKNYTTLSFMPLYPLLINLFSLNLFDKVITGVVISIISLFISLIIIYKLALNFSKNKEQSFFASLLFLTLPGSFFLITFQETSLLTLLGLLVIYFTIHNKNFLAALFFGLGIYTNILGIFLIIPIYFIKKQKIEECLLPLITGVITVIAHSYFLYLKTGDIFTILSSKIPWYSDANSFLGGFFNYFKGLETFRILEISVPIIFIFLMILVCQRMKSQLNYFSFILMFLGISILNAGFTGIIKYLPLCLTPYAIYLFQNFKHKKLLWLILILGLILNVTLFTLWTLSSRLVV